MGVQEEDYVRAAGGLFSFTVTWLTVKGGEIM